MSVFVNRIIATVFFFFFSCMVNAQVLPVWYKVHGADPKKINFIKFIKNNSTFSLVKVLDTVSVPEKTSVYILDREGKFVQELLLDTVAYCNSKEQIIAGRKKNGRILIGIITLKEEPIIPMEYLEIKFYKNLFAVKNTEYLWAVFEKGNRLTEFIYTDMSFTSFGKIKVKDKRGAGILNEDGSLLFDNIYGEIEQISVDSFLLKEQDRWDYLDRSKNSFFSWSADSIKALNDSLYLQYSEGRVFIKDSAGVITGSDKGYHGVEKMNNRLIRIYFGEYSGLIDLKGKEVLPVKYYDIKLEKSGHIKALGDEVRVLRYGDVINKSKQRWSLHDSLGRKVLPKQYKTIRSYQEGMVAFQNDENLWGYANEKGTIQIEPQYQYASDFKNGYALVREPKVKENDYRLINAKQELFFTEREAQLYYYGVIRYRTCEDSIREGEPETELHYGVPPYRYDRFIKAEYGYIRTKNGSYSGMLDSTGREAVQAYQDTIYHASSDTFFLYKRNNGLLGYSDRYCNTTLALTDKFEGVQPLQNGYSKFKKEGLYGFIDPYGNVHIAPKYTACGEFHDGRASVFLKGKWGFIDKEENLTVQPYYKEVKNFRNGFAPVKNIKNKWIFIDKKGAVINTSMYDDFREIKNGKYLVFKNKRWGITTSGGKEILSPKYDYIEEISPSLLKIKKDGKFGVMDFQENIVLYYQYDDVIYDSYRDRFFVKWKGGSRKVGIVPVKK